MVTRLTKTKRFQLGELLFEQAVMTLTREMPVATIARFVGTTDNRFWRIIGHYVAKARGYRNVTNFITMVYLIAAPIAEVLVG